jgi:LmbE family N-acetylglucosaminyl deacetylase
MDTLLIRNPDSILSTRAGRDSTKVPIRNPIGAKLALLLLLVLSGSSSDSFVHAQTAPAPPRQGAELLKTDILAVFAHPDDETGMAATLAYYALGKTSVVAHVYCTRGEGGGNMVGTQSGAALGILREAELRDALTTIGIRYCYFLDQLDWAYTESSVATLRKWGKEKTLEKLVRLVRALRPEIIVTMNPAPTPGQHGHHQAAGILATEAFTAAADLRRFPDQLTKEGIAVWQPRRLYYAGGSASVIVTVQVNQALPNGKTAAQLAGAALSNHRSQAFGNFANSPWLQRPQSFGLIKSFVPIASGGDDLLAGLPAIESDLSPSAFASSTAEIKIELAFVSRPVFAAYQSWIKEQGIEHVGVQFQADLPLVAGEPNDVRLQLANNTERRVEGELKMDVPIEWSVEPARQILQAAARASASVRFRVTPPTGIGADGDMKAIFTTGNETSKTSARGHPLPATTVKRLGTSPAVDATDRGWEGTAALQIAFTNLAQGKANDAADSSATFRLAHDGKSLFVDVHVKDDIVISNIAPNDIKGHWRSDSVEICIDPVGGAEHTMGCFKLGIFPFDTTGAVRAARDADANQGPVEETAPMTRLVSKRTADGYRIQAAIPFSEVGVEAARGKRLGFNLIIYDGDKRDAAQGENINESRIAWAPRPGVQGRPEDWGRIDLE